MKQVDLPLFWTHCAILLIGYHISRDTSLITPHLGDKLENRLAHCPILYITFPSLRLLRVLLLSSAVLKTCTYHANLNIVQLPKTPCLL